MTTSVRSNGNTLKLVYPIEANGQQIDTVSIRRPTVADMLTVQSKGGGPVELELAMVALLTGLPVEAISQLDMKDYGAIQAVLRNMTSS